MKTLTTLFTLLPLFAFNQTITFLGSTPNNAGNVHHIDNSYFLNGTWGAVSVFDYTDPANLSNVGGYSVPGDCWFLKVIDTIAYFGGGTTQTLTITDVSDPNSPINLTTLNGLPWIPTGVAVKNNYLYLTFGGDSLYILDQTNLSNPVFLDTLNISGNISNEMVIVNNVLCIATQNGLKTYDLSSPETPSYLGSTGLGYISICADPVNNRVFVSKGTTSGFDAIDISNPASPALTFSGGFGSTGSGIGYYNNTVISGGTNLVAAYAVTLTGSTTIDTHTMGSQITSIDVRDSVFFTCDFVNASIFKFSSPVTSLNAESLVGTKIFPIPTNDVLNISSELEIDCIRIYSLDGSIQLESIGNTKMIDITSLHKGIYIVEIRAEGASISERIVKI